MKLTKMAGAFALTAALAMGTVPAFAAASAEATTDKTFDEINESSASQSTDVTFTIVNAALNATIPTKVAVVVPSNGGAITAPTSDVYQLKNNGTSAINVTNVAFTNPEQTIRLPSVSNKTSYTTSDFGGGDALLDATLTMKSTTVKMYVPSTGTNDGRLTSPVEVAKGAALPLTIAGKVQMVDESATLTAGTLGSATVNIAYTIGTA